MNDADKSALAKALAHLEKTAKDIRRLEAEANAALHGRGDKDAYRALLIEKCELLAALPESEAAAPGVRGQIFDLLREGLADFAQRASQAMEIGSVFYMLQLLYPEDYKDGELNGLEIFIAALAGSL